MSYNYVNLSGRLTRVPTFQAADPSGEPHKNDRGWCVLAHNPNTKRKDVDPVYMAFVCWGRNARILRDYGKKGKGWGIEGRLKTQTKELADGTKYTYAEVVVTRHEMGLDAKNQKDGSDTVPPASDSAPNLQETLKHLKALGLDASAIKALAAQSAKSEAEGSDPF